MSDDKKQEIKKEPQKRPVKRKISSLDIDKNEYQEIVLSHSNRPEQTYYNKNY